MYNLCQVLQLPTINLLVRPCEVVASSDGCVGWIFLQQFLLDIIHDGCTQEDAHRRLALGEQVQLFLFRHRSAPLASCKDDGLCTFWNGELTSQLSSSSQERRDARGDVVGHLVLVEESHLLLNGSKDAGIARVQTHDEMSLVVVLLHQGTLFFKVHVS